MNIGVGAAMILLALWPLDKVWSSPGSPGIDVLVLPVTMSSLALIAAGGWIIAQ